MTDDIDPALTAFQIQYAKDQKLCDELIAQLDPPAGMFLEVHDGLVTVSLSNELARIVNNDKTFLFRNLEPAVATVSITDAKRTLARNGMRSV